MPRTYAKRNNRKKMPANANKKFLNNKKKNLKNYRNAKNKFASSRRPFVEVKSQSHVDLFTRLGGTPSHSPVGDVIENPTTLTNMVTPGLGAPIMTKFFHIWSFMNPTQGVGSQTMIGRTITAKYLTAKVHFEFPVTPQVTNPRYYIVHGWVKVPCHNTMYTDPTRSEFTRANLIEHIQQHLTRDFDENAKSEFLSFNEKRQKDYIVLGYKRIKPNQNAQEHPTSIIYNTLDEEIQTAGIPSDVNLRLQWPMNNKKITYSHGTTTNLAPGETNMFMYPNDSWLPFMLYYSPDAGAVSTGASNSPSIAYNDKFWFTDS